MKSARYLLIGAGVASSQAAKQLRRRDPEGSVALVGEEPHAPYDRPPLSKEFLRGEKAREKLFFDSEDALRQMGVQLALGVRVERLDAGRKVAILSSGEELAFEKALIATGGRPLRLNLPGDNLPGVHYLRTLDDSAAIRGEAAPGRRAVIIGGGFIGMELAASLTQLGVGVTVIEAQPHIWSRFTDATLAGFFQDYCTGKGVTFLTSEMVAEIRGNGRVSGVVTRSGKAIPCDFVCIGVGIAPNVELAQQAGLEVANGVVVNEYLRTSHPDIYAAGDVANYLDPVFGKRRRVEHWGHAEYCGQVAGLNMAGGGQKYGLLTYVWSDIFDLHLEFAGDESEHDEVLIRGRLEDRSFTVLYLKEKVLRAYFAINTDSREFPVLKRLIQRKTSLAGKEAQLADRSFNLRGLV